MRRTAKFFDVASENYFFLNVIISQTERVHDGKLNFVGPASHGNFYFKLTFFYSIMQEPFCVLNIWKVHQFIYFWEKLCKNI